MYTAHSHTQYTRPIMTDDVEARGEEKQPRYVDEVPGSTVRNRRDAILWWLGLIDGPREFTAYKFRGFAEDELDIRETSADAALIRRYWAHLRDLICLGDWYERYGPSDRERGRFKEVSPYRDGLSARVVIEVITTKGDTTETRTQEFELWLDRALRARLLPDATTADINLFARKIDFEKYGPNADDPEYLLPDHEISKMLFGPGDKFMYDDTERRDCFDAVFVNEREPVASPYWQIRAICRIYEHYKRFYPEWERRKILHLLRPNLAKEAVSLCIFLDDNDHRRRIDKWRNEHGRVAFLMGLHPRVGQDSAVHRAQRHWYFEPKVIDHLLTEYLPGDRERDQ